MEINNKKKKLLIIYNNYINFNSYYLFICLTLNKSKINLMHYILLIKVPLKELLSITV